MSRARSDAGFALVAALWALLFAAAIAGGYLAESRHLALVSRNRTAQIAIDWQALAGLEYAKNVLERLRSIEEGVDARARTSARQSLNRMDRLFADEETTCVGGACFRVRLADAGARLNVNVAGEDALRRLFEGVGVDSRRADIAAQSVADWIDADDLHRARGAEREHYDRIGALRGPRNGPIPSVEELLWVQAVHHEMHARIRPYLTVEGDGRIHVNAAPEAVLAVLPGVTVESARRIAAARARGTVFENPYEVAAVLSSTGRAALSAEFDRFLAGVAFAPSVVEVSVEAWENRKAEARDPASPAIRYRAVYHLSGVRARLMKRWREDVIRADA